MTRQTGARCTLCGNTIRCGEDAFRTPDFIADDADALWPFSDAVVHRVCFFTWEGRKLFTNRFNRLARGLADAAGAHPFLTAEGDLVRRRSHPMKTVRPRWLALLPLLVAGQVAAQQERPPSVAVAEIPADPRDVGTIDGIMRAFYEVISGPAGEPRQWARDRSLYIPGVRFTTMGMRNGRPVMTVLTHQQYVDQSNAFMVREGFWEEEIHRVTDSFGNVTHVWSTYEIRNGPGGAPRGRGVNSLQLAWDGERWWILSASWDSERGDNPIPSRFLPATR